MYNRFLRSVTPKIPYMTGFKKVYDFSLRSSSVDFGERCWFAHFKVDGDFSRLFPFIQATANEVVHYEFPEYIRFQLDDVVCALYPPDVVVSRLFYGREQALEFAQRLIDYLNELESRKFQITPDFKKVNRITVPEILPFLPLTNCGGCGFPTCMAFAGAVSRRKTRIIMCPHFPEPVDARIIYSITDKNSEKIRTIGVDLNLAGLFTSRITAQSAIKAQKEENTALNHTRGLIGNRDDIVFRISGREVEVLRLITEGFTNKEIAQILKVSLNTVKSHVVHIFDKLGVHDRTQAAVWATQNELI